MDNPTPPKSIHEVPPDVIVVDPKFFEVLDAQYPKGAEPLVLKVDRATTALRDADTTVRKLVTRAAKGLLSHAVSGGISPQEQESVPQAVYRLAHLLRSTADLASSLADQAQSSVHLSQDEPEVIRALLTILRVFEERETAAVLPEEVIKSLGKTLDNSASALEKSLEVFEIVDALHGIEIGVNNLPITKEEFDRLSRGVEAEGPASSEGPSAPPPTDSD